MASVTDYGATNDPLSGPGLPAWAKAIADALNNSDVPVDTRIAAGDAAKVSKAGDTMTGPLTVRATGTSPLILGRDGRPDVVVAPQADNGLAILRGSDLQPTMVDCADPVTERHAATKGYVDALNLGGQAGDASALPAGTRMGMKFGYAGVPTGGDVGISWGAGFTKNPHLITHIIGYADASTGWTVSSTAVSLTGTTLYVRKNNSGAGTGGAAVLWIAIGAVA